MDHTASHDASPNRGSRSGLVDAHHHLWRVSRGDYRWLTPDLAAIYRDFDIDDLVPVLKPTGVQHTVLVQAAATLAETRFLLDIADSSDRIAGVVGWVDFAAADAAQTIADLAGMPKLKGLRPMIQDIADDDWMLRSRLRPAFEAMIEHKLTFDALVLPRHLPNLLTLLRRYPDLKVVIDHAAKPRIADDALLPWADDMRLLAAQTQSVCKISGLVTEAGADWNVERLRPFVEHLLDIFGPARLMWGSDWPVVTLAASYQDWLAAVRQLTASLGTDDQRQIFSRTAVDFYGLDRAW